MKRQNLLRYALLGNALFSTICAIVLVFYPSVISELLGWQAPIIYQMLGVGLIIFALELCHQAKAKSLSRIRASIACVGDFSWVIVTFIVVSLFHADIPTSGTLLLFGIALAVFLFGLLQSYGIHLLKKRQI